MAVPGFSHCCLIEQLQHEAFVACFNMLYVDPLLYVSDVSSHINGNRYSVPVSVLLITSTHTTMYILVQHQWPAGSIQQYCSYECHPAGPAGFNHHAKVPRLQQRFTAVTCHPTCRAVSFQPDHGALHPPCPGQAPTFLVIRPFFQIFVGLHDDQDQAGPVANQFGRQQNLALQGGRRTSSEG